MVTVKDSTHYMMRENINKIIPIIEQFGYIVKNNNNSYLTVYKNDKIIGVLGVSDGTYIQINGTTNDFNVLAIKLESVGFNVTIKK